jgi:hypothetical protein
MVLYCPELSGTPSFPSVDLPTVAGNALYARCSQAKGIVNVPKETDYLLSRETYSFDVMFGYR